MTIRWMEGAARLDTSRGSRFMRGEADLNPTAGSSELDPEPSTPAFDESAGPQDGTEASASPARPQVRATRRSADLHRNAG
jgi:hypothetical protein